MRSFRFLEAHLTIRTDTRQLGKVPQQMEVEEEADDDNALSVGSARSSSQPPRASQPNTSQASPSQVRSSRPKALSTTGKRVDEAILKLAEHMVLNTSVQDRLATVVQDGSNEWLAFCQWMGLEAASCQRSCGPLSSRTHCR